MVFLVFRDVLIYFLNFVEVCFGEMDKVSFSDDKYNISI